LAEDEQERPRRRTRRPPDAESEQAATGGERGDERGDGGRAVSAAVAARKAAQQVADFTGRSPECVVSIDRADGGWQVGVEVVETRRIPDTQDVLAIYEVRVDGSGDLVSYQRTRRYARGQLDGRCR
jgi:hypothetical protein